MLLPTFPTEAEALASFEPRFGREQRTEQRMAIRSDPERFEILALDDLVPDFGGRRVLEIGCGDGRLTRRYADRAASVLAIDPDAAAIAAFRQNMPAGRVEVRAIAFDDDDLALADRSLDIIIFSWSL